jgi:hypothetical protein
MRQSLTVQVRYLEKLDLKSQRTRDRNSTMNCWTDRILFLAIAIIVVLGSQIATRRALEWLNHEVEYQFLHAPRIAVAGRI